MKLCWRCVESCCWLCSTRLSTAGLLPGLHIVSVGALLRPGLCGLLRLRLILLTGLAELLLTGLILPRLRSLRIEPARPMLVLRTLGLRRPILLILTAKALL